jgi:hypothetical protein
LAFSYWIDIPWFHTEGKLAAIFIKPSLGVSNWPVIYFINYTPTFSGTIQHHAINKFSGAVAGELNYIFPRQLRASKTPIKFSGAVAGEKEDFCKGSFARTSFTLF